jgi:shikimate dehydrogenase
MSNTRHERQPADRYAVLGHPVAHSQSPFIHAAFARQTGESMTTSRVLTAPMDGFEATVRAFAAAGGRGCNVTVPFKFEVPALAAVCSDRARLGRRGQRAALRCRGLVRRQHRRHRPGARHRGRCRRVAGRSRVLLVGAGGAGAGVLGPLLQARDGLGMLVEQAAEAFFVWRGVRPPTAPVLAALRLQVDGGR